MTELKTTERKTIHLLARVSSLLVRLADEGFESLDPQLDRELANVIDGLRFFRLHRLLRDVSQIRYLLTKDPMRHRLRVASCLSDARYTCKAVKTALKGRLDDPRIANDVLGKDFEESELAEFENRRLVLVGEQGYGPRSLRVLGQSRKRFFAQLPECTLLCTAEDEEGNENEESEGPAGPLILPQLQVDSYWAVPSFAPQRIRLGRFLDGRIGSEAVAQMVMAAERQYDNATEAHREQRSNVFAPKDWYCLLAFHEAFAANGRLALIDASGHVLPLVEDDPEGCTTALRHLLLEHRPDAIFGSLRLHGHELEFSPLSAMGERLPELGLVLLNRLAPFL